MDNPELIEIAKSDLNQLLNALHKSGLNYWQILGLLLETCQEAYLQSGAEYYVKGGK